VTFTLPCLAAIALLLLLWWKQQRKHLRALAEAREEATRVTRELTQNLELARKDLEQEHDLSTRILHSMREGVMVLDATKRIVMANPALCEMLSFSDPPVGRPLFEVIRLDALARLVARTQAGEQVAPQEFEVGSMLIRRVSVLARNLEGEDTRTMLVFVDVTELRQLERLRSDFVANVSHELRTPVTSILSAAETLPSALARKPEQAETLVKIIERNSERLRELIDDLLDLSKLEARSIRITREPIDLNEFLTRAAELVKVRADQRRMRIIISNQSKAALVSDRRALERITTNLLDNAVKYGREQTEVELSAFDADGHVRIRVVDRGPGIAENHIPRLFERFYRVDQGRSRDIGGTGLGLAICKHLVEALRGRIEVTSELNVGSSFSVYLPIKDPGASVRSLESAPRL
jgi:two-component system, OmpR family, phosphate regulon sensor histidine kinase PhoR